MEDYWPRALYRDFAGVALLRLTSSSSCVWAWYRNPLGLLISLPRNSEAGHVLAERLMANQIMSLGNDWLWWGGPSRLAHRGMPLADWFQCWSPWRCLDCSILDPDASILVVRHYHQHLVFILFYFYFCYVRACDLSSSAFHYISCIHAFCTTTGWSEVDGDLDSTPDVSDYAGLQ